MKSYYADMFIKELNKSVEDEDCYSRDEFINCFKSFVQYLHTGDEVEEGKTAEQIWSKMCKKYDPVEDEYNAYINRR